MKIAVLLPARAKFIQISFNVGSEQSEECSSCLCMLGESGELFYFSGIWFFCFKTSYCKQCLILIALKYHDSPNHTRQVYTTHYMDSAVSFKVFGFTTEENIYSESAFLSHIYELKIRKCGLRSRKNAVPDNRCISSRYIKSILFISLFIGRNGSFSLFFSFTIFVFQSQKCIHSVVFGMQ